MLSRLVPTLLLVAACGVAPAAAPPDPLVRPEGWSPSPPTSRSSRTTACRWSPMSASSSAAAPSWWSTRALARATARPCWTWRRQLAPGRQLYLVTTHVHPEHDLGAQAFPASAQLIRSTDQVKDIEEFGLATRRGVRQAFAADRRAVAGRDLPQGRHRVRQGARRLDLGGVRVRIIAMGANHTGGDTAVFVEPDRVLFSGDVTMRGQPAFASPHSSLSRWLTSLDRFDGLKPLLIVPSHGKTGERDADRRLPDLSHPHPRRDGRPEAAGQGRRGGGAGRHRLDVAELSRRGPPRRRGAGQPIGEAP